MKTFFKSFSPRKKTAQAALRHPWRPKCLKSREQGRCQALISAPTFKKVSLQNQFAKNFCKNLQKFYFCKFLQVPSYSGSNWQKLKFLRAKILFAIFCKKLQFLTRASRVNFLRAREKFLKNARAQKLRPKPQKYQNF